MDLARRVAEAADLVTVALDELLPRADGPPRPAGQAPSCPAWNAVKAAP